MVIVPGTTADWPGGDYMEKLPQSFMAIVVGTFVPDPMRTAWLTHPWPVTAAAAFVTVAATTRRCGASRSEMTRTFSGG